MAKIAEMEYSNQTLEKQLAKQGQALRESDRAELRLKDEVARLHALQLQPRFRFVPGRRSFGSEECDSLELWNDGPVIELHSLHQASYVELSFAVDPSDPAAGAKFAATVEARYGMKPGAIFSSVLEERVNLSYMQELFRHPANPLGLESDAEYTVSLEDEWDIKYLAYAWDRLLMPSIKRLGIARRIDPYPATTDLGLAAQDEQCPELPHVRYIPSYYYHRRDYDVGNGQPGRLVTLYAWEDGNPGANYTREFARLTGEIYKRFGRDKVTVSRRTFLSIVYADSAGARHECTFDVYPRDPWGAVTAKRVTETLSLRMGFEVDMRRITGESVLWFCSVPPALSNLSKANSSETVTTLEE